jgi:hypothetical protein
MPQAVGVDLLAGNLWPNATLEMDSNRDGVPDFWHRGGTAPAIARWSTARSVSTNLWMMIHSRVAPRGRTGAITG